MSEEENIKVYDIDSVTPEDSFTVIPDTDTGLVLDECECEDDCPCKDEPVASYEN